MARRLRKIVVGVGAALLAMSPLGAHEPPQPSSSMPPPVSAMPPAPEPMPQWLDEVRAQRQAREERRRAAKESMDARRRRIDPWGAAHQEAREKETQRRRDAFMEKVERDRDAFRSQAPWGPVPTPWWDEGTGLGPAQELHSPSNPDTPETTRQSPMPAEPYSLPGWDNRWYYRGY